MLTVQERIYGLSLIWSEAKYNFAFWNTRADVDWDAAYSEALCRVSEPMELLDYYLVLSRFLSLLNDGHTYVEFPKEISRDFQALPIRIRYHNGRHLVANAAEGCPIPVFGEILEIDGRNFSDYMRGEVLPYCWNIKPESAYTMLYPFQRLEGTADKNAYALIPILKNNREIELLTSDGCYRVTPGSRSLRWTLPQQLRCSEPLTEQFCSEGLVVRLTGDGIAVLTLPTFMDHTMPENFYRLLHRLNGCRGFVIDLRNNGGGHSNNAEAFTQAFIEGPFQTGRVKHAVHIGAYKAWGDGEDFSKWDLSDPFSKKVYDICTNNYFEESVNTAHYPDCPLTLRQPVVILENAATASSSENMLISFDQIGRAVIVGVPSYGSTGNPLFIKLPGGGLARICTRRYTYPDGREFQNIGVRPHIDADLTQDDLAAGRDGVLDRGLAVLRSLGGV